MSAFGKSLLARAISAFGPSGKTISSLRDRDFVHCDSPADAENFGGIAVRGQKVSIKIIAPGFTQFQLSDNSYLIVDASSRPGRKDGWMVYASNDPA
jgi:hypothetical protein